jgi:hypothetical protein
MDCEGYAVILVYSTSHALRAEKALREIGIPCKLIPVPRHLSSDCGVCVRIGQADVVVASQVLEGGQVEMEAIHTI